MVSPWSFELVKLAPRGTAVVGPFTRLLASLSVLVCFFLPYSFVVALARKRKGGGGNTLDISTCGSVCGSKFFGSFRSDIRFYLSGQKLINLFVGLIPFRNVLADSLSLLSEGSLVC
eukprot:GHVT01043092.1.p1 GENE.GHVT01043092.1~~GHVT01043092.1.p1  ORF type:complete len:117 (-),score=0.69 GHVT01043092.1:108-458(-)